MYRISATKSSEPSQQQLKRRIKSGLISSILRLGYLGTGATVSLGTAYETGLVLHCYCCLFASRKGFNQNKWRYAVISQRPESGLALHNVDRLVCNGIPRR
jgi:hypothetical protein